MNICLAFNKCTYVFDVCLVAFAFCVLHLHSVIAIIFDNCMICAPYCYYCTYILHTYTPQLSSVLSR